MKIAVSIWGLPSLCPSDPNEETLEQEAAGWEQGQSEGEPGTAAHSGGLLDSIRSLANVQCEGDII